MGPERRCDEAQPDRRRAARRAVFWARRKSDAHDFSIWERPAPEHPARPADAETPFFDFDELCPLMTANGRARTLLAARRCSGRGMRLHAFPSA